MAENHSPLMSIAVSFAVAAVFHPSRGANRSISLAEVKRQLGRTNSIRHFPCQLQPFDSRAKAAPATAGAFLRQLPAKMNEHQIR
jgi:hypothetical protein